MARIFHSQSAAHSEAPYPVGVPRRLRYPDIPAWGLLSRAAALMPGRLACTYNDVEWTWEELDLDARRAAAALKRLGVCPGDRVGVLLPNIPEYVIALNGIWRAGGVAVALSPLAVQSETDRLLEATNCRFVICLDMLAELISGDHRPEKTLFVSLRPRLPLFEQLGYVFLRKRRTGYWWMSASEHVSWFWDELNSETESDSAVSTGAPEFPSAERPGGELRAPDATGNGLFSVFGSEAVQSAPGTDWSSRPAYILPTGGTTGTPKAVTLSHRNMVVNAWQQFHWAGSSVGRERLLAVLPFFHSYGLSTNVMGGAAMVASLVMDHRFSVRKVVRLIEKHRPTVFHAVPAMLVALNQYLKNRTADLASLKWVISGGAPLPESVGREFAEHSGALVVEGYGLSEAAPVTHVGPLNDTAAYGTIGLPLPDTECRILAADGNLVSAGEVGELSVRGPQVMLLGYWNAHSQAAERGSPVTADGWLPTGDMARQTRNGLYQIVERKKDLIITSGFNVFPGEVERKTVRARIHRGSGRRGHSGRRTRRGRQGLRNPQ